MTLRRPGFVAAARLTQTTSGGGGGGAVTSFGTGFSSNITCVGAWGTLKRNPDYTGFAMTVEDDSNPGTTTEVSFNAAGLIRGALPYGTDTRVVTLYDQFGSSDLFATLADDIRIRQDDFTYGTWLLDMQGVGELSSTVVTGGGAAWELGDPVWACGFKRVGPSNLRPIWGVASGSNFMEIGLWQEFEDLHWRVNGSSPTDWANTNWFLDAHVVQVPGIERAIGDMSSGSPALGYYNGVLESSRTYTAPIVYTASQPINIGGGLISDEFDGLFSELAVFNTTGTLSVEDKDNLDDALSQANFFETGDSVIIPEQRMYTVLGTPSDGVSAKYQRTYAVLGSPSDAVSAKNQRLYAIIVP